MFALVQAQIDANPLRQSGQAGVPPQQQLAQVSVDGVQVLKAVEAEQVSEEARDRRLGLQPCRL